MTGRGFPRDRESSIGFDTEAHTSSPGSAAAGSLPKFIVAPVCRCGCIGSGSTATLEDPERIFGGNAAEQIEGVWIAGQTEQDLQLLAGEAFDSR